MPAISIKKLTKVYAGKPSKNGSGAGVRALHNVDMEVAEGDFFALLGANGAGKTTIISILTGLVVKTFGKVKVFDTDMDRDAPRAKSMIGVVPQEFNFNVFEKVQDIVITQAGYFGIKRQIALRHSEEILKK